jgi:hypothetical protein
VELSAKCIDDCLAELEALDLRRDTVTSASNLVRATRPDAPELTRQVEHFAFTLLATLFKRLQE